MKFILVLIGAYLLGSSNMALYLGKWHQVDVRTNGTGNPGASNVIMLLGWKAGLLVMIHDIGKASLAVFLTHRLLPDVEYAGAAAGVTCILGHMYPFYAKFRGGKGVASYVGMALMLNWAAAIAGAAVCVVLAAVTDAGAWGVAVFMVGYPVYMGFRGGSIRLALILGLGSLLVLWKHRDNFIRLLRGREVSFKHVSRGDYRVK